MVVVIVVVGIGIAALVAFTVWSKAQNRANDAATESRIAPGASNPDKPEEQGTAVLAASDASIFDYADGMGFSEFAAPIVPNNTAHVWQLTTVVNTPVKKKRAKVTAPAKKRTAPAKKAPAKKVAAKKAPAKKVAAKKVAAKKRF